MEWEDPAHGAIQTHRFPTEAKRYRVAAPVIDGQRILRYLDIQGAFPVTDAEFHAFPLFGKAGIDPQGIFLDPYPAEALYHTLPDAAHLSLNFVNPLTITHATFFPAIHLLLLQFFHR